MYHGSRVAGALAIIAIAMAAWLAIAWARADAAFREQSPEGIQRAVELAPDHRLYSTAAAIQAEYDGGEFDGKDSEEILRQVAARHPRAGSPRLRLGLAAEVRGDAAAAERWLLDAYAVDKMFETRWALANFYFRQGREDDFWVWIKRALEISYGDRRPAFDLCWRASEDSALILERAVPEQPDVLAAYVSFLLERRQADALGEAARRLANLRPNDAALVSAVDALLDHARFADASQLWQAMGHPAPSGITNGNFSVPPSNSGFDWRPIRTDGVTHVPLDAGRGYRIRLSGNQPEQCELLRQWAGGLRPGQRYTLHWDAEGAAGVEWRIADARAAMQGPGDLVFTAPAEAVALSLVYARPSGQVRAEANIDLRRVWID